MAQTKRVALIIGNSNYDDGKKVSGVENAKEIDAALKDLGFEDVDRELITNATLHDMTQALDRFKARLNGAAAAVFYYSGHGFHVLDKNYLLPREGDVSATRALAVSKVLGKMDAESNGVKLVILDTCREKHDLSATFAEPEAAPAGVYQAFSASPGQLAQSGKEDELSLYTTELLQHIREPGLKLPELFDRVRDGVRTSPTGQYPIEAGDLPQDFCFRPPVEIQLKTFGWPYSRLLVFLNGELVLPKKDQAQSPEEPLAVDVPLRARRNNLVLMVSNGKTYHNGQVWGRTESWSYKLDLRFPVKNVPEGHTIHFEGREDVPFKDGPHHGQTFVVAEATLFVDPVTAEVTLPSLDNGLLNPDTTIALRELPFWAQDQEILFQAKLVDLQISPEDILPDSINFSLAPLFRSLLTVFLKTGKILDTMVVDPEKTFVAVRGNKALRSVAQHCMTQGWPDRLRDLRASFVSFFNDRNPRPFDVFSEGLDACIRANALSSGITRAPEELRVWTSLDDLSAEPQTVEALTADAPAIEAAAAEAPATSPREALSDESLRALAQEAILHPRKDEALISTNSVEQAVQGVLVQAHVYTFLSWQAVGALLQMHARVIVDLSDLQNKIGPLIDTIPLPTDNCSHFGLDNIVARIWGKQITINENVATLKLNGDVEVWTCVKNPVQCSRIEWEERNVLGAIIRIPKPVFYDCNPPIKNKNLSQPFEATLPFQVEGVDSQSYTLRLGDPSVDLGGPLGSVTEGILKIAGVDVNAKVKEVLDNAINPDTLKQTLPEFVLKYNPTLARAELLSNSGALALSLEMDATLTILQLGELIQELFNNRR